VYKSLSNVPVMQHYSLRSHFDRI